MNTTFTLINMPVADSQASERFFKALGFPLNTDLSDERARCFDLQDKLVVALLPAADFKDAINGHQVASPETHEVLLSIGVEKREEVDTIVTKALGAGAKETQDPVDMPEIYGRAFADLDGHLWNIFCMASR